MGKINIIETGMEGLHIIEPTVFGDSRGYFVETYNQRDLEELGIEMGFVQDSQSMSVKGVLRGLHYQKQHPQGKIVRAIRGAIYDVAVDLRRGSQSFGKWFGIELSEENHRQLLIPEGFAHGFMVLSEVAAVCYKATDFYHPGDEGGIAWNDPELGIQWPSLPEGTELILSEKDKHWPALKDAFIF